VIPTALAMAQQLGRSGPTSCWHRPSATRSWRASAAPATCA
jgi:hypothetical protein